jgi:membrane protein
MTTVGPLLVAISIAFGTRASVWLKNDQGFISQVLAQVFKVTPFMASGLFFTLLFFFIPNVKIHIKDALGAGALTGGVFEIAKYLYSAYAKSTISHDAIYGTLIIIPVFLVWLYVLWLVVLFGAEFCFYLQFRRLGVRYHFSWEARLSSLILSDILEELSSRAKSKRGGLSAEELQARLQLPYYDLMAHVQYLLEESWVVESKGKFILGAPIESIQMTDVIGHLDKHRYTAKNKTAQRVQEKMKAMWSAS